MPIKTPLSRKDLYHRPEQPAITSRIEKHGIQAMTRQTRPGRKIHLPIQTRMKQLQEKWNTRWGNAREYILNKKQLHRTNPTGETQRIPYICHIENTYTNNLKIKLLQNITPLDLYALTPTELTNATDIILHVEYRTPLSNTETHKETHAKRGPNTPATIQMPHMQICRKK